MAHPLLRPARSRVIASIGLAGALLVPASPAFALGLVDTTGETIDQICDGAAGTGLPSSGCDAAQEALDAVDSAVAPVTEPVEEALAPVTEPVEEALAPLTEPVEEVVDEVGEAVGDAVGAVAGTATEAVEAVQSAAEPVTGPLDPAPTDGDGDSGPLGSGSGTTGSTGSSDPSGSVDGGGTVAAPAPAASADDGEVQAAGKAPEEVTEPQAPAAGDGRVAGGPSINPSALGGNIPGISSDSGLTLQPYDAPLVSVPLEVDAPQVAGAPVTTSSPVAAVATGAIDFAGDVVLPYTSGAAAWVTAAGLGLLGAAGYGMRRRYDATHVDVFE